MNSPYLNLYFGVFIAVVDSSSFIFGFFTGDYVSEKMLKEEYLKRENSWEASIKIAEVELQSSYLDIFRDFKYKKKILLESKNSFSDHALDIVKQDLASQINSLECMLATVADHEMREKIQLEINEVKPLVNTMKTHKNV